MCEKFTVAMSVYKNDNPLYFAEAVHSIYEEQSIRPSEIIMVIDGPIPASLEVVVQSLCMEIPIMRIVRFNKNRGHAAARQAGLEKASNDLVAIMDSDDIANPNRFKTQLELMDKYPDVAVVGSIIEEFIGNPNNVVGVRAVPEWDEYIKKYLKSRCPMNLMTVMYRKSQVEEVGGFQDWYCEEDYFLWIRLAMAGHKFYNYQKSLVNVRVGEEMYKRRGGKKYFQSEAKLQKYMLDHKLIAWYRYVYNVVIRWVVQVAMPNNVRGWVFKTFARSNKK